MYRYSLKQAMFSWRYIFFLWNNYMNKDFPWTYVCCKQYVIIVQHIQTDQYSVENNIRINC